MAEQAPYRCSPASFGSRLRTWRRASISKVVPFQSAGLSAPRTLPLPCFGLRPARRLRAYLDTLVAGTSRHPPPVKVERNIMNKILMVRRYAACHKHDLRRARASSECPSPLKSGTLATRTRATRTCTERVPCARPRPALLPIMPREAAATATAPPPGVLWCMAVVLRSVGFAVLW